MLCPLFAIKKSTQKGGILPPFRRHFPPIWGDFLTPMTRKGQGATPLFLGAFFYRNDPQGARGKPQKYPPKSATRYALYATRYSPFLPARGVPAPASVSDPPSPRAPRAEPARRARPLCAALTLRASPPRAPAPLRGYAASGAGQPPARPAAAPQAATRGCAARAARVCAG